MTRRKLDEALQGSDEDEDEHDIDAAGRQDGAEAPAGHVFIQALAVYASALINGDYSGLDDGAADEDERASDRAAIDKLHEQGEAVDMFEEWFGLCSLSGKWGTVTRYTVRLHDAS